MSTDEPTPPPDAPATITCSQCGHEVPRLAFCVRCGDPLSDEYSAETRTKLRGRFAAAPNERANTVALVSTLFPQLPHAQMGTFRIAVLLGLAIVLGIGAAGFFPIALAVAAVLVPLLMVGYLWVVDVYEDDPILVIGATMAWGAVAGALSALYLRPGHSAAATVLGALAGNDTSALVLSGIGVPLLSGVLMLAGPLLLLPARRFNDVLDGATFAAASAVSFGGAQVLVQAWDLFGAGLRPQGDALQWAVQLTSLALLQPIVAAGTIGSVGAAFWLRYRAPVTDRAALGAFGMPIVAVALAALILVIGGLARALLPLLPETAVMLVLALIALVWLRRALQVGLTEEASEIAIGPPIQCPNCGQMTPLHSYCGHCGIMLRALPHGPAGHAQQEQPQ